MPLVLSAILVLWVFCFCGGFFFFFYGHWSSCFVAFWGQRHEVVRMDVAGSFFGTKEGLGCSEGSVR